MTTKSTNPPSTRFTPKCRDLSFVPASYFFNETSGEFAGDLGVFGATDNPMPATPRATRRSSSSRRPESNSKDAAPEARPQSLYEPTSVQDRIRQWQAQGAADASSPDTLSVRSIPCPDHVSETPRAQSPAEKVPRSAPTWRQRFLEKERELRAEEKATARCYFAKEESNQRRALEGQGSRQGQSTIQDCVKEQRAHSSLRSILYVYAAGK